LNNALSIIPLGGVEEIGLNSTVFEYADDMIIVDAGLMFPEEDMLGVDFVIPDYSYVLENREKIRGIIVSLYPGSASRGAWSGPLGLTAARTAHGDPADVRFDTLSRKRLRSFRKRLRGCDFTNGPFRG